LHARGAGRLTSPGRSYATGQAAKTTLFAAGARVGPSKKSLQAIFSN
jgi:hypothetical protein